MFTSQLGLPRPIAIRYPRGNGVFLDWENKKSEPYQTIAIGKAKCLKEGTKIAVLSNGTIGNNVTEALAKMEQPTTIAHYDFSFVKPLDELLLHQIFKTFDQIITLEDGVIKGGFGSAITEFAAQNKYHSTITILGIPDEFIEQGTIEELQQFCKIDIDSLVVFLSKLD